MDQEIIKIEDCGSKLTYAYDSSKSLVYVDDVPNGQKCNCTCPACGEKLIARNGGTKRIHHFAHLSGHECKYAYESMLHILAKEKISEAFIKSDKFFIKFHGKSYCNRYQNCEYHNERECHDKIEHKFDIKKYYDSVKQEVPYDNINRRSDLKIYSSTHPDKPAIYLEFCVSHASDEEKLSSGNKIIEIKIETEEDINEIIQNGINESSELYLWEGKETRKIKFFGFVRNDYNSAKKENAISFVKAKLRDTGKVQVYNSDFNCKLGNKKLKDKDSLLEINMYNCYSVQVQEIARLLAYDKCHIPNCVICENYVYNDYLFTHICKLYKVLNIPREVLDTSIARTCRRFKINENTRAVLYSYLESIQYEILE